METQARRAAVGMELLCAAQIAALLRAIPVDALRVVATVLMFGFALGGLCFAAPCRRDFRRAGWALAAWTALALVPVGVVLVLERLPEGRGLWLANLYLYSEPLGELAWCALLVWALSAAAGLVENGGWVHMAGQYGKLFLRWTAVLTALGLVSVACGTMGGPLAGRLSVWLLSVILAGEAAALVLGAGAAVLLWRGGRLLAGGGRG